jgi:hypothetical protein
LAAVLIAKPKNPLAVFGVGVLAAVIGFIVATPGALLDREAFLRDFSYELQHTSSGHGLVFLGTPNGFLYNLVNLCIGIDALLVLLGVGGLFYAAYKRHAWAVILLAFWLPYYVVIGRAEVKFLRYSFPLYVGVAAGVGYAIVAAHRRGRFARLGVGIGILGFGGLGGGGIASTVASTVKMVGQDPRDAAAEYLRSSGGTVGLVSNPWFWSPPLFPNTAEPLSVRTEVRLEQAKAPVDPAVELAVNQDGTISPWEPRLITEMRPDRVAFSSFEFLPLYRLRGAKGLPPDDQPDVDRGTRFLDLFDKSYTLEKEFGSSHRALVPEWMLPEDALYAEPMVWVWKRN